MHPGSSNYLHVGCWNVRTLVEADGDICTGVSRPGGRRLVVDRKVEFLVWEPFFINQDLSPPISKKTGHCQTQMSNDTSTREGELSRGLIHY